MKKPIFENAMAKMKDSFKSRAFRAGGLSVAAAIAVIALAVTINILVNRLPSTATQIDVSTSKMFTLSEQTEQLVSGLTEQTEVFWIVGSGKEDDNLTQLLNRYADLSDKLTVTKVDPVAYPSFASQYTSEEVGDNSLIVTCGDRSDYVPYSDLYEYDYSSYTTTGSYSVNFAGESRITSAIDYVNSADLPIVYVLTGNGEAELSSLMQSEVKRQNMTLQTLSLLTVPAVPEDADCVLILGPAADITEDEAAKLKAYIEGGGNLMLLTGYSTTEDSFANLVGLMENYGVTTTNSLVIEGDDSRCITGYNYYLLPQEGPHAITNPLIDAGYYVLAPMSTGITRLAEPPENIGITELLITSDSAYAKSNVSDGGTVERSENDASGPFDIGVAIEYTVDADTTTHIVWYSSSAMLDDSVDQVVSGGNSDLFINSLGFLCERESAIAIHVKSLGANYLTVSDSAASLLSLLMIGILPIGFLAAGIYVGLRRKRR